MTDRPQNSTYYWNRVNRTLCLLDLAIKGREVPTRRTQQKYLWCTAGYKAGKTFGEAVPEAFNEIKSMCQPTVDSCGEYVKEVQHINQKINAFKRNFEDKLKHEFGPCDVTLSSSMTEDKEFCNCETYILASTDKTIFMCT